MKTLLVICGAPAVGKTTVGHFVADSTGFKLFHNHMSIEPVLGIFDFGSGPFNRIVRMLRENIIREAVRADLPGLIFTYAWAFNLDSDRDYMKSLAKIWEDEGGRVCFAELNAKLDVRLVRNRQPDRLERKVSKRDVIDSERRMREHEGKYQFDSNGNFPFPNPHIQIDNTSLPAREAAKRICNHFGLT